LGQEIFEKVKDGVLLCKLINTSVPNTIDLKLISSEFGSRNKTFLALENHRICLKAAQKIGCKTVNISSEDLLEGNSYLVFGLIWQIIRIGFLHRINIFEHPELKQFVQSGENLPAEGLLLRWFNYHLEKTGSPPIHNFGSDLKDSSAYIHLIHSLDPILLPNDQIQLILSKSLLERAKTVIAYGIQIDSSCSLLTANDILDGSEKLNLCFIANLFHNYSGMVPLNEDLEKQNSELTRLLK
jgi:hypothetical protein